LDAHFLLTLLFGKQYGDAAATLRVLALGLLVHNFFGANGATLIALGRRRIIFYSSLFSLSCSIGCGVWLAPKFGAFGVAIGVVLAQTVANLYLSATLWQKTGIHPFHRHFLLPVSLTIGLSLAIYTSLERLGPDNLLFHAIFYLVAALLPMLAMLLTHTFTSTDLALVAAVESKLTGRVKLSDWLRVVLDHDK
jgi:O-antigen/teichoic acid export membrane protein